MLDNPAQGRSAPPPPIQLGLKYAKSSQSLRKCLLNHHIRKQDNGPFVGLGENHITLYISMSLSTEYPNIFRKSVLLLLKLT